jgi:hypothetical protein
MSALNWIQAVGTIATTVGLAVAGTWAYLKLRKRREHARRWGWVADIEFVGRHGNEWVVVLVLKLVNRGLVRIEMQNASFELRCASKDDLLDERSASDEQFGIRLPHLVKTGDWFGGAEYIYFEPGEEVTWKHLALTPGNACLFQLLVKAENLEARKRGEIDVMRDMVVIAAPEDGVPVVTPKRSESRL